MFILKMGIWQGLFLPSLEPEGSQAPQDNFNLGKFRPAFLPKNSSLLTLALCQFSLQFQVSQSVCQQKLLVDTCPD